MNELPLLQTFLAVYRLNSVTRAAEILAMTQPGASGHLKVLEARLGKVLFVKEGRGLRPTPAAHDFARSIGPHLDAIEASVMSAKAGQGELSGSIQLGGPAEFLSRMVSPRMGAALKNGLRVEMHFDSAQELVAACNEGKLDLVVSTLRIRQPGVGYAPLYRENFALIASPALAVRLADCPLQTDMTALLDQEPMLAYAGDLPILRRFWRDVFDTDLQREAALIMPDLRAIVEAVSSGLGFSVVPHYLCENAVNAGKISNVRTPRVCSSNELLLGWNKYAISHPRVIFMRDFLLQSFADEATTDVST